MPTPVPTNTIGLTRIMSWDSSFSSSPPIVEQLTASGVQFSSHTLPAIVGMGGAASLICYTSPKTHKPVTVLVVPNQYEVDAWAEDYFHFDGLDEATATAGDRDARWDELYEQCRILAHNAGRNRTWLPYSRALTYADVVVGAVVVEAHNGVRNRITEVDGELVTVTPIDNPLPVPRRNAPGRTPVRFHIHNLCGSHLLLTNQLMADLDTAAYAELLSLGNSKIAWLPYDPTTHAEQAI